MESAPLKPYLTVEGPSEEELIEKRSRFIGRCWHVTEEKEVLSILEQIRKEHWDASHNCYAYILRNGLARYSDDGEPSGTAGLPIMEVLKKNGVTDTLVIVTRYFGGILLGTGGLVRAYTKSAGDAVKSAKIVRMTPCSAYSVRCPYPYFNTVRNVCQAHGQIETSTFLADVETIVWVEEDKTDRFIANLTETTEGRIGANRIRSDYFPFAIENHD